MVWGRNAVLRWLAVPHFIDVSARPHLNAVCYFGLFVVLHPCRCTARPRARDPEIKPQAFFSHTEQIHPGDSSRAAHLVSEVTNRLEGKLATFNDVVNLQKAVGMQLERQIVDEVTSSSVFVAILTPAFSQRFWPMYELHQI